MGFACVLRSARAVLTVSVVLDARSAMFALVRQFSSLGVIGQDGDLEVDDCDGSYNRKTGNYNGYDGGFVVNVSCPIRACPLLMLH